MKKLFYLPALAAALFFTSCSSDEPAGPENPEDGNGRFMTVNIMTAGGSRASESDFENGEDIENTVENALFSFYDEKGNLSQTPQLMPLTLADAPAGNPYASKISTTTVVIAGQKEPAKMLVVLNPPSDLKLNGYNLTQALALVGSYNGQTDKTFVMSNSSYYSDGIVTAIDVTKKVKSSRTEAEANPVDVYVERVLAKITTDKATDFKTESSTISVDEVGSVTLTPEITGVEIANVATQAYLFKDITGISDWMDTWTEVNDFNNKRSYWATTLRDDKAGFSNKNWNQITDAFDESHTYYVLPNTSTSSKTAVLVKAILKDKDGKAMDLVKWSGNYYKKDAFKRRFALFLNNEGYRIKEASNATRELTEDDVDYISANDHKRLVEAKKIKAYQTAGCVKDGLTVVKIGADNVEATPAEGEIENYMTDAHHVVDLWEGGRAYYFTNIKHHGPAESVFEYGVVRNHVYKLTLSSIQGLGVPVVNPDEPIIPEHPEDKLFYVGAKVRILKWRIVNQTVNFGK